VLLHGDQYKVADYLLYVTQLSLLEIPDDIVDFLVGALYLHFGLEKLRIGGTLGVYILDYYEKY